MPNCAIYGCNNRAVKGSNEKNISFFRFPQDPTLRQAWIHSCKRADFDRQTNFDNQRICSVHFCSEAFELDFREELTDSKRLTRLRPGSVPSLLLPSKSQEAGESRVSRARKRQRARELDDLLKQRPKRCSPEPDGKKTELVRASTYVIPEVRDCRVELVKLRTKVAMQGATIKHLKARVRMLLRDRAKEPKKMPEISGGIGKYFTQAQIRRASHGKRKIKWKEEDVRSALTLRTISRKAYDYLRTVRGFPLPGMSTLRRWVKAVHCEPGILDSAISLMAHRSFSLSTHDKCVVLSCDEMSTSSRIQYDPGRDLVYGPSKNMCVFMARGLFANWKQVVYFDYDVVLTKDLLYSVVGAVESAGYEILALVSDMGAMNRKLWSELGVSSDAPALAHPMDSNRKIFCFADVPHLLKLLRNHILDSGLSLAPADPSASVINRQMFEELLRKDNNELKLCPKLTPTSITLVGAARQRVRPAAQLLSARVANALLHLSDDLYRERDAQRASFIHSVDQWFDVMNSREKDDHIKQWKSGYGRRQEQQDRILKEMIRTVGDMRVGNKRHLLPFQQGIKMSTLALQQLGAYVKDRYDCSYILTHRLNQDCLENFFARVRGAGGFQDHPSALEARHRVRLLLVGASAGEIATSNVSSAAMEDVSPGQISSDFLGQLSPAGSGTESSPQQDFNISCTEQEALNYISGFVAHKMKHKLPAIASDSSSEHSWISRVSLGHLTHPSEEWFAICQHLKREFLAVCGEGVPPKSPFARLEQCIAAQDFYRPACVLYMKVRLHARIKHMNKAIIAQRLAKRQSRKLSHFTS